MRNEPPTIGSTHSKGRRVKLPQKPSGRANRPSRGSTSTQPIAPSASPTSKRTGKDVSSLGTQQAPQDATAAPAHGKKKRLLFVTPNQPQLNAADKKELETLRFLFNQMPWLECETECPYVRAGSVQADQRRFDMQMSKPNDYDGIIYYKRQPLHTREGITSVELKTFDNLTSFVSEAVKELYRREIIR